MLNRTAGLLTTFVAIFAASAALAVPISMSPSSQSVNSIVGNDFTLDFDGGDTTDNVLNFTLHGAGGCGFFCGSTSVAAMVFDDGISVLSAGDTESGWFNSNNVIRGLVTPGGNLAAIAVDFGNPTSESFWAQLSGTPTTATLYSLSLNNLGQISGLHDIVNNIVDAQPLRFSTASFTGSTSAMPEPSAALVFAAGLLVARRAVRTRR